MIRSRIEHPIPPFFTEDSRILILGSFPSVKTRESGFFYGHPQNRFWKVMAAVFDEAVPVTVPEKKAFLARNRIALWDVIQSCDIAGSSDASIQNVIANDLSDILNRASIERIFVNGRTAERYYRQYTEERIRRTAICLPSTSPANAAWKMEDLIREWKICKGESIGDV